MRTPIRAMAGLLLILVVAACGGSGASAAPTDDGGNTAPSASTASSPSGDGATAACEVVDAAGAVQAEATGFAFTPDPITAATGEAITWTNGDPAPHTVTLDDGTCDTGEFGQGETGTLRFNAPGTYAYHCAVHPNMKGTIEITG